MYNFLRSEVKAYVTHLISTKCYRLWEKESLSSNDDTFVVQLWSREIPDPTDRVTLHVEDCESDYVEMSELFNREIAEVGFMYD